MKFHLQANDFMVVLNCTLNGLQVYNMTATAHYVQLDNLGIMKYGIGFNPCLFEDIQIYLNRIKDERYNPVKIQIMIERIFDNCTIQYQEEL